MNDDVLFHVNNQCLCFVYHSDVQSAVYNWTMCKRWVYVARWPYDQVTSITMWSICCVWIRTDYKFGGKERFNIDRIHGCWWKERPSSVSQSNRKNLYKCWSKCQFVRPILLDYEINSFHLSKLYICWMDKQTLEEVTYRRYGSVYPWPLNYIQNYRKRNAVVRKLKVFNWASYTNEQVVKKVRKCCVFLKEKLGDNQYFYGDRWKLSRILPFILKFSVINRPIFTLSLNLYSPTELDALVFGHIFTILTTPLPNNNLQHLIKNNFESLVNLCFRIEKEFFSKSPEGSTITKWLPIAV